MVEAVGSIAAGRAPRIPQDESRATYDPLCTDEHAAIAWERPAREVYDLIRGCDPQPGAHTAFRGARVRFYAARMHDGAGRIAITRARAAGGKQAAAEVAAALGIGAGDRLGGSA